MPFKYDLMDFCVFVYVASPLVYVKARERVRRRMYAIVCVMVAPRELSLIYFPSLSGRTIIPLSRIHVFHSICKISAKMIRVLPFFIATAAYPRYGTDNRPRPFSRSAPECHIEMKKNTAQMNFARIS